MTTQMDTKPSTVRLGLFAFEFGENNRRKLTIEHYSGTIIIAAYSEEDARHEVEYLSDVLAAKGRYLGSTTGLTVLRQPG